MPNYTITAQQSDHAHAHLSDIIRQIHLHKVNALMHIKTRHVKFRFRQRTVSAKNLGFVVSFRHRNNANNTDRF